MKKIANRDARAYVACRQPFVGSNMFAEWRDNDSRYVVYSYGKHFPMYIWTEGHWYGNADKYSRTTSKHQSQCRPLTEGGVKFLSNNLMYTLAVEGFTGLVKYRLNGGEV